MLMTPKDPPGSAGMTASPLPDPVPKDPDAASTVGRLQHEVALLTARRELEEARAATAALAQVARSPAERASPGPAPSGPASGTAASGTAASEPTSSSHTARGRGSSGRAAPSSDPAGTIASWVAHHQLGVAVESIGGRVARALGVVPAAEREAMSAAVTEALVKSAREHLDRTAAAELTRAPRSALEQACMAALDRQAQLSIEEARRRNALEDDPAPPGPETADTLAPGPAVPPEERAINVLVTDDPLVTAGDWQAQLLTAQVSAHQAALDRLRARTTAAAEDLEATVDCWVRATPASHRPGTPGSADLTPEEQWRSQAGLATSAAAIAGGIKLLTSASQEGSAGPVTTAHSLGLQLLDVARSDLTVSHRAVSVGSHELVVRGAAALASNLGQHGRVVADELTTLAPESSPLLAALHDLMQQRAALAESAAALAGLVDFAGSLVAVGQSEPDAAGVAAPEPVSPTPPRDGPVADTGGTAQPAPVEPDLRELARQALLHERAVEHVVDALGTLDRDLRAWTSGGVDGASPPLLAAITRERLHSQGGFSHVLVLQDEGLTADVVSRHSVLGDAGRRTHVGSARVSWLLLDVASGAVVEGGQAAPARTVVQDVSSGRTTSRSMTPLGTAPLPVDTQHSLEVVVKFLAVAAGLAALILSVVALITLLLT